MNSLCGMLLVGGEAGQKRMDDPSCGERGDACGIGIWEDFHQIHPDKALSGAHAEDQPEGLMGGEAADFRRPGSRRIGGVEEVDVKGDEDRGSGLIRPRMMRIASSMPMSCSSHPLMTRIPLPLA